MSSDIIEISRVIKAPPERVFRAFITPGAVEKWFPPHGFLCKVHELDSRVGGRVRFSLIDFPTGYVHSCTAEFLEVEPCRRLRYRMEYDNPYLAGKMEVTVTLRAVFCGVELHISRQGTPATMPREAVVLGWQDSFDLLAKLVEADARE